MQCKYLCSFYFKASAFRGKKYMKVLIMLLVMMPSYVYAWSLPGVGEYKFKPITKNVYVMHGPLELPNKHNMGFMNNPGIVICRGF